jgi:ABC-type spermidine/putrescine transport system permease subunit II
VIQTGVSPVINALSSLILISSSVFVLIVTILKIKLARPKM